MAYISSEDFIKIALDNNMDLDAMMPEINKLRPKMEKFRVNVRLKRYIQKGLLPLPSGNKVSTGETLKGSSTLYDADGNIKLQWVKTDTDKEEVLEAFTEAIENMSKEVTTISEVPQPLNTHSDLLVKIPIADMHIGLLTWHKEVTKDFDLSIAKQLYLQAFSRLLETTPAADTCLILDLGDTLHSNDHTARTPTSGNILDVDGRFSKQFDMALYICYTMIDLALQKYNKVIFRKTEGNHDQSATIGLSAALEMRYHNNPRVTIERSPNLFWWYQFGKTLHFSTHGHTVKKASDMAEIAAHDAKSVWSECNYVYIDYGHYHHKKVEETRTALIECHNTLTPADSYSYGHGYRSKQNIKAITYHKEHGEISRSIIPITQLL